MSETTKTVETNRKAAESVSRGGQAAVEAVGKATRDTADETLKAVHNGADHAKAAAHTVSDVVAETADVATTISSKVAEQSREAIWTAARTAAGVGSRVADISFGRSHNLLNSTVQALDVYRDASERSAERVHALFTSYLTLGRGLQQIQHAWLEIVDHTLENATHKPQDLLRAKSLVELAEVQRDLYLSTINHAVESGSRLLELAGRTAQDAVRPLQTHHH
nr:phasin family protein [uncultured Rhodopila sp.]